jgi:hypothetical protein
MPTGDRQGMPLTVRGRPLNLPQLPRSTGPARARAAAGPKRLSAAGDFAATSTRASQPDNRHDRRSTSICSVTHRASSQAWSSPATAVAAAASAARSAALSARCLVTTAEANNNSPLSTAAAAPMPPTVHMVAEPRSFDRSSQSADGERSSGTHRANGHRREPAARAERRPLGHPTRDRRTPTRGSRRRRQPRRAAEQHRIIHPTRINKAHASPHRWVVESKPAVVEAPPTDRRRLPHVTRRARGPRRRPHGGVSPGPCRRPGWPGRPHGCVRLPY